MSVIITWATPENTDVRNVRVDVSATKAGTYTAVDTISATSDSQQKGSNNSWVLSYTHSGGTTSNWYKLTFIDSNSAEVTSDAYSEFPNTGRPYGMLQAGQNYLQDFDDDTWTQTEFDLAQNAADTFIEGRLGTMWHTGFVPDQIVQIALMYGSGLLIVETFERQSPNISEWGQWLIDRAEKLLQMIIDGELKLEDDSDGDGTPDEFSTVGNIGKAKSGNYLKKLYDPTKEFYEQGGFSRVAKDSDQDWY